MTPHFMYPVHPFSFTLSVFLHFSLSVYVQETVYPWVCPYVYVCMRERYVGPWICMCTRTHTLVDAYYYVDMEMQKEKIHLSTPFLRERLLTEHEVRLVFSKPMWLDGAWFPQFWGYVCMDTHDFLYGSWYSNSGFHAWLDSSFIH